MKCFASTNGIVIRFSLSFSDSSREAEKNEEVKFSGNTKKRHSKLDHSKSRDYNRSHAGPLTSGEKLDSSVSKGDKMEKKNVRSSWLPTAEGERLERISSLPRNVKHSHAKAYALVVAASFVLAHVLAEVLS